MMAYGPMNGLDQSEDFQQADQRSVGVPEPAEQQDTKFVPTDDDFDTRAFVARARQQLPKFRHLFEQHAQDLDWRLLAAVSYQESHWKPDARSHTGVRGLMMLTNATAKEVGVKNRVDPAQSVRGGAHYLRQLVERVPATIAPKEKIWFALAAYNMGYGHMMDARKLTRLRGKNPNSWDDVRQSLPLLHDARWHRKTRYGYARGREARQYVKNIRRYYQNLRLLEAAQQPAAAQVKQMRQTAKQPMQQQAALSWGYLSGQNVMSGLKLPWST